MTHAVDLDGRASGSTRRPSTATSPLTVTRRVDQVLADPPAAEARPGQHLLEPRIARAGALLRSSAPTSTCRATRRHRAVDACSTSASVASGIRSRRRPCSSASTTSAPGTNSASGGRSSSVSRPSRSRNSMVVPNRTAWPGPGSRADLVDVAALLQRAHHAVDVDAADGGHLGPGDRLLVGHDRQRLERGATTGGRSGPRARSARRTAARSGWLWKR